MTAPSSVTADPHEMTEQDFFDHIHSFQFWFESVEGYLSDRPYGQPETVDEAQHLDDDLDDERRDRLITTLCNYCVGETAALEGAAGLVAAAPNRNSKIYMATQVVDEARHLEVFLHRLREFGVPDAESEIQRRANPALVEFKGELLDLVDTGDWTASVFAQNVVLETMELTVFRQHAATADPLTAQVLTGVIADERRHAGFGESDIGRILEASPGERNHLRAIKARLDPLVIGVFEAALADVGAPAGSSNQLTNEYLHTVSRLGLT